MLEPRDIYWVAGLLEGEGCFSASNKGRQLLVSVNMTDRDVMERLAGLFSFGRIYQCKQRHSNRKPAWLWSVHREAEAAALMMMLYPLMGERRRARIEELLAAWKARPVSRRYRTHCPKGHSYSGANLRISTHQRGGPHRSCRECENARQRDVYKEKSKWL